MKPSIAIPLGLAGILAAIATAIANANGLFAGHPHLSYWFYGCSFILIVVALVGLRRSNKNQTQPDVALEWEYIRDEGRIQELMGKPEKHIVVHNRSGDYIYNVQIEPVQLDDEVNSIWLEKLALTPKRWSWGAGIKTRAPRKQHLSFCFLATT
jgi:hypothetical protein